ncbi:MAG: type III-B CRISPR module RAMP protein Cmr4, partial [Methylococcaceae bacterium]|nr:type III-B CRISPR module RAMP protein Cmr4 [Methylococcaceae bacterium]
MKTAMLGLHAETSIHAGAGAALDVVDLPIQREAPTGWPCVFGSAIKGALRACAAARGAGNVELVFGPKQENAETSEFAGALLVGDARLVLLPVRSLSGHFKWVTCPAALERLKRDAERLGLVELAKLTFDKSVLEPSAEAEANAQPVALAVTAQESLFLEEYCFTVQASDLSSVIAALAQLSGTTGFETALEKQLVVVDDDDFAFLARHATPVTPHVALDSNTKTTIGGALWYEETLPPETLLYVCLAAHDARKDQARFEAKDVL